MDTAFIERIRQSMDYERARVEAPAGFPKLPEIPGGRYTETAFLQLEDKYLWKKSWLYACHTDELPKPGSFILWKRTGSPILIVRTRSGEIRAFYNTCRHRGGPLVKSDKGSVEGRLVCGYHGWSYDLDGKLVALREKRDFPQFDMNCYNLIAVRCELLGPWVFVNEDPHAEPLLRHLGPIPAQLEQFQLDTIRHVESRSYPVNCNMKIMMDAFLETYHLSSIHQNTVDRFLDHRGTSIMLWPRGHSLMFTPNRREDWVDPGTVGMKEIPTVHEVVAKNNASWNFYPNLVSPMAATGIPFLVFWPTGLRTMQIDCHWFAPDWGAGERDPLWDKRLSNFERILAEDTQFGPQIQESVDSVGFKGITIGYQERRIYHWHEELDRRIGPERIPEHLRVKPMLDAYVEHSV